MKIIYLSITIFSVIVFLFSLTFLYYFITPLDSFELYSNVNISEEASIGFDLNSSALTFGVVSQYGASLRKITLTNSHDFPIRVKISSSGKISEILDYPPREYISPNSNISIPITVYSGDNPAGLYEGKIKIRLFRAVNR
ncbi:MAG: hypothetical protein ACP5NS_00015 [Candidatus Pacearchaeota archaeon]